MAKARKRSTPPSRVLTGKLRPEELEALRKQAAKLNQDRRDIDEYLAIRDRLRTPAEPGEPPGPKIKRMPAVRPKDANGKYLVGPKPWRAAQTIVELRYGPNRVTWIDVNDLLIQVRDILDDPGLSKRTVEEALSFLKNSPTGPHIDI